MTTTWAALQRRLAAPHRAWQTPTDRRAAAVLVPIVDTAAGPGLLFIERRADLRHHAGQIAFPGGSADGDEDPVACALRELQEEVGIAPSAVEVLGGLPCHGSGAGFHVHPIVGRVPGDTTLRLDRREVESTFIVPVLAMRSERAWDTVSVQRGPVRIATPAFRFGEHQIWGLTGRVTRDLLELWP